MRSVGPLASPSGAEATLGNPPAVWRRRGSEQIMLAAGPMRSRRKTLPRNAVLALLCGAGLVTTALAGLLHASRATFAQPSAASGVAAFQRIATVLNSPRCLNCHPREDRPRQGDDRHVHLMNVQRGKDGKGLAAMRCSGCHQEHNNDAAGVPGAPHWHLPPRTMGWTGLSVGELCRTLLDPSKNGGRSVADLVEHMTTDALVLWAWRPGRDRTAPPLSTDELKSALEAWAKAGAPCPN